MYSHPAQPIRHSYPLAISAPGFGPAVTLVLRTMPFVLLRLGLMVAFLFAAIIWLILCAGVAYLFSGKGGDGSGRLIFFVISVLFPAGIFLWVRQYVFYLLKCGHVAVLTRLITHGELPTGVNQVQYGKETVIKHFAQTNVLFAVDALVTGVVRAFNRSLSWFSSLLPIPGMQGAMRLVQLIVHRSTTFIDETILSYNLARGDENVWRSAADGLVYYAANAKPVLKTAILSLLVQYALTICIFILCLGPAYAIGLILPSAAASNAWLIAVVLAETARMAILEPILLSMIALTFHHSVNQQPINEEWASKLESLSTKFIELKNKAVQCNPAKEQAISS